MSDNLRDFLANARGMAASSSRSSRAVLSSGSSGAPSGSIRAVLASGSSGAPSASIRAVLASGSSGAPSASIHSGHSGRVVSLDELRSRPGAEDPGDPWGLAALRGRLVELSARGAVATMTAAIGLVLEAQTAGEPVAWIAALSPHGTFYPPDVADSGVDLAALVVVRAPDVTAAARAAERLLRSGAFGLIVIDGVPAGDRLAAGGGNDLTMAHQGRLVTLAQAHDAAIVCITDKPEDTASLGSLVSLRVEALRTRTRPDFELTVRALKDKRRGPGWIRKQKVRGPMGLG